MKPFWFFIFISAFSLSCVHTDVSLTYGIQPAHRSFVPARIAVLGCQPWPNGARYRDQPLSNVNDSEITKLCDKVNQFVISGFSGEAFMRGLTPKAVSKALSVAGKSDLLAKIDPLWGHQADDCVDCDNPVSFYVKSISTRKEWREYLAQFASAVSQVDALLLPMVTDVIELENNDRGVIEKVRRAGLVMLLVDTGSGQLIWAGGRRAQAVKSAIKANRLPQEADFPPWDLVYERLFQEDVWREFPGRQML